MPTPQNFRSDASYAALAEQHPEAAEALQALALSIGDVLSPPLIALGELLRLPSPVREHPAGVTSFFTLYVPADGVARQIAGDSIARRSITVANVSGVTGVSTGFCWVGGDARMAARYTSIPLGDGGSYTHGATTPLWVLAPASGSDVDLAVTVHDYAATDE